MDLWTCDMTLPKWVSEIYFVLVHFGVLFFSVCMFLEKIYIVPPPKKNNEPALQYLKQVVNLSCFI